MLFGLFGKKDTYEPQWFDFEKQLDGKRFAVHVDLGHELFLDQKNYKSILVISFELQRADLQGLPTVEDVAAMTKGADKVLHELQSLTKVFLMGSITGGGQVLYYFAALQAVDEAIITEALKGVGIPFSIATTIDDNWNFIKSVLYPSNEERQRAINSVLIGLIKKEQGKDMQVPQPKGASHTICFKTAQDALHCLEILKPFGYYSLGTTRVVKDAQYPFFIEVGKDELLTQESINKDTDTLIDIVSKENGSYDGWQPMRAALSTTEPLQ